MSFTKSSGVLFHAVGVTTHEASFVYHRTPADSTPIRDTVVTWAPHMYGDLVQCGTDGKPEPSSAEAARLVCPGPGGRSAGSPRWIEPSRIVLIRCAARL
ncbi:hypothetical protein [Streptomyces sp. NPDC001781]